ncbi:helix-turn-helix domain-containing protein [Cryobacterium sp. CG_9.6]|uniref:helix-turn-helix transcriptional regulator n=1 Tax=Cryobacterium sp. CG_9.6 TaxID=2760710 RepID=UPI002473DF4C|nr:helix-turn-helix domain-containing protein [Cryobacterium sp. CG_9.6]MDH6238475.1 putative ArsR family transcriptional regulator [Cryobacterium sp. CG_9.6]
MDARTHMNDISAVASMSDPLRRKLFDFVSRSAAPVGRDEAASALGVPRSTAAFHLDRLAANGLLASDFQRLSGRTGPGSGRPAKLYRPAVGEIVVSIPERHYELAADLLSSAIDESHRTSEPIRQALTRVAIQYGRALGAQAGSLDVMLESSGYEPHNEGDGVVTLTNCPFHQLAQSHTETICQANVALLQGAADGADEDPSHVRFDPGEGRCCARIVRPDAT